MKTFLFQGDSITDASRDDEEIVNAGLGCGYAFFLASEFEKQHQGMLRFINRGDSGDRITDVYARIKEDIINLKPDIMSILIGINDVSHELTMQCGVSPKKFRMIYEMLIDEIKECLPEIRIIIMEPFVLKGTATEKLWTEFYTEVRKMAAISQQVAEKYGFDFVPLQDKFDALSNDKNAGYWSEDGVHPTIAGHHLIKEELQKVLEKYINEF
ncbi:MAG: lysophospholipase [Clostridia bacterium]|nr:lysophospholipase [Clostridia bacterium]